jgi:hypothetical protein
MIRTVEAGTPVFCADQRIAADEEAVLAFVWTVRLSCWREWQCRKQLTAKAAIEAVAAAPEAAGRLAPSKIRGWRV